VGTNRPLFALAQVDELLEYWPECCYACARRFGEDERIDVAVPQRHQVSELPPIAVKVSEYRLHRLRCPACAAETRAELPADVRLGAFGCRLQAAAATLAVRNRVSRRDTVELRGELFGCRLSTGTIDAIVQGAGAALEEPQARLADHVRSAFGRQRSTRPAGACAAASARSGARSPSGRRSSGSPPTATSARPGRCSARASRGSPARIAGGPTTTSTPGAARSAGHT